MYPQFDSEQKVEHLQGYLYVQQAVKNFIFPSGGGMYQYAIDEYSPEIEDIKSFIIDIFLQRLSSKSTIDENCYDWMQNNTDVVEIKEGKNILNEELKKWFIDDLFDISKHRTKHIEKYLPNIAEEAKSQFINNINLEYENVQARANSYPSVGVFLSLFSSNSQIFKLKQPNSYQKSPFSDHYIDLFWGIDFDIYIIRNKFNFYILHFGFVIT